MTASRDFISHSSKDDPLVARLREALHAQGVPVWTDSQFLSGGVRLKAAILEAIEAAPHLIVVLSPHSVASVWVKQEATYGRRVEKARKGFKIIPILLDGMEPAAMPPWLGKEPVGIRMSSGPGGVHLALPSILEALGRQLPADHDSAAKPNGVPVAELVLELTDPSLDRSEGKHRGAAVATLTYLPPDGAEKPKSKRYRFLAPLGPIEAEDVSWYLERYCRWPSGPFQERARQVEQNLPRWGRLLYDALAAETARPVLEAWNAVKDVERRFSVLVDQDLMDDSPEEQKREAGEAATLLLGLPWELMHGAQDYLFQGPRGVQVRRLPVRGARPPLTTDPPIRVLLASPRPEDDSAAYLDHRASARPLVEALRPLGELVEWTLLAPPTFRALEDELRRAHEADRPYHVVHFDGHGVYDKAHGLGALCFEHPDDAAKLDRRRGHIVNAEELARVVNQYRVPLVFLEACETARSEQDPTASVAGRLLQGGVNSVVAMSHSVLVETARRFVAAFYQELMAGRRVGAAVPAGRRELKRDAFRGKAFTGPLHLEDWFVPVLFQEEADPQLIREVPPARVRAVLERQHRLSLGAVPPAPGHTFVGRSRELLRAERLLERKPYVVLRGEGGEGKTTLAAELALWLVPQPS